MLAPLNGATDENVWLAVFAATQLDPRSSVTTTASMNWFDNGQGLSTNNAAYNVSVAYRRSFLRGLSGTAAVALDGISRENLPDFLAASGLLGLRYSFF